MNKAWALLRLASPQLPNDLLATAQRVRPCMPLCTERSHE
ncbi:hypothetical protein OH686_16680 [Pseudomonas sp. SO81]|nr:hypothetical protein OH686_16680 [Pseudomonas sp. SO81]